MFLAGELERPAIGPPTPPPAGEAANGSGTAAPWARSPNPATRGGASLRDIQSQEAAAAAPPPPTPRAAAPPPDDVGEDGALRVPLAQFVRKSAPIAVARAPSGNAPAWGGPAGGSPPAGPGQGVGIYPEVNPKANPRITTAAQPSLRCIQAEQEQLRDTLSRSWGAAGASPGGRGGGSGGLSQWRSQSSAVSAAPVLGSSPGARFGGGAIGGSGGVGQWRGQSAAAVAPPVLGSSPGGFTAGASPPGGRSRLQGNSPSAPPSKWSRG